jgi:hypothetical protein
LEYVNTARLHLPPRTLSEVYYYYPDLRNDALSWLCLTRGWPGRRLLSVLVAFFDEHDRDAVAYGIPSATGRAGEKGFLQHDLFTASGTNQNVQKLLTDQS